VQHDERRLEAAALVRRGQKGRRFSSDHQPAVDDLEHTDGRRSGCAACQRNFRLEESIINRAVRRISQNYKKRVQIVASRPLVSIGARH
jgi:hypothetical protein